MADNESSELVEERQSATRLGPGRIVLVVGPSGVGKDALLQGVAALLRDDDRFVFPRRIISRPEHAAEDHDRATPDEMETAARDGAYALSWRAHGVMYGISTSIDAAVQRGSTVIFNASRTVVAEARNRYCTVRVIYIDTPREIRAERLARRGRESEAEILERLSREVTSFEPADADVIVNNDDSLDGGVAQLLKAFQQTALTGQGS